MAAIGETRLFGKTPEEWLAIKHQLDHAESVLRRIARLPFYDVGGKPIRVRPKEEAAAYFVAKWHRDALKENGADRE